MTSVLPAESVSYREVMLSNGRYLRYDHDGQRWRVAYYGPEASPWNERVRTIARSSDIAHAIRRAMFACKPRAREQVIAYVYSSDDFARVTG